MDNANLPSFFEFYVPTKIQFGCGLARDLSETLTRFGSRVFLITDQNLVKVGLIEPILKSLQPALTVVGVYDEVPPNSEIHTVHSAYQAIQDTSPDFLLAIGGGSVMDTAKAANILKSKGGELLDHQGVGILEDPLGPLVCIPTTAGTGSEVTKYAVIKDQASKQKILFMSPTLCPNLAILDPEMLVSLPRGMTAASGMDALTHAIEGIVALQGNFITEAAAFQVIRLVSRHLEACIQEPANLTHRSGMLIASTLGGMAFNDAGVGIIHAMAHALGGHSHIPHGTANSIMLPFGIEFNRDAVSEKYVQIAEIFGIREQHPHIAIDRLITTVRDLAKRCGLPITLKAAGLESPDFSKLAEEASCDGSMYTNPKEATSAEIQNIYELAYS